MLQFCIGPADLWMFLMSLMLLYNYTHWRQTIVTFEFQGLCVCFIKPQWNWNLCFMISLKRKGREINFGHDGRMFSICYSIFKHSASRFSWKWMTMFKAIWFAKGCLLCDFTLVNMTFFKCSTVSLFYVLIDVLWCELV